MANELNRRLKQRLQQRDALLVPGAADALAARIIEDLGFEAVYVTGAGVTNSFLGVPDLGLITLSELANQVGAMRDSVSLPLIVDVDTGFGNPVNVTRTVRVIERSGANAIQIEDQTFPKKCGHFDGKAVIGRDEMAQKIKAALDSRKDEDFIIIARTDARAEHGLEEALERAALYTEIGADATFVEAPQSLVELAAIPRRLAAPQIANMVVGGRTPLVPQKQLREMGFALVAYANAALQAGIHGMQTVLNHLREHGSTIAIEQALTPFRERQRLVGKPLYDELERRYTGKG